MAACVTEWQLLTQTRTDRESKARSSSWEVFKILAGDKEHHGHNSFCLERVVYRTEFHWHRGQQPSSYNTETLPHVLGCCTQSKLLTVHFGGCWTSQQKPCCLSLSCSLCLSPASVSLAKPFSVQRNIATRWDKESWWVVVIAWRNKAWVLKSTWEGKRKIRSPKNAKSSQESKISRLDDQYKLGHN